MPDFKITWDTGLETTEHRTDCQTVEQFNNSRFGAGVIPTAKVELVIEVKEELVPEPDKVEKPAAPVAKKK